MRPSDVIATVESKKIGRLADRDDQREINSAERNPPNSVQKRAIRYQLQAIRDEHVKWVRRVVDRPEKLETARKVMIKRFTRAMMLGHAIAGVANYKPTDAEILSIASMAESELEYLTAFASEAMGKGYRSRLYGGGVTAAFYRGWLAMLPDNARILWKRSIAESCSGCIELEAGNPWSKPGVGSHPLWTVPQNAPDTPCGANCKCFLEATVGPTRYRLAPLPGIEVTAIGNQPVNPTKGIGLGASQTYQNRAELLAWYERMAVADTVNRALWQGRASALTNLIENDARAARHTIRNATTLRELLEPVDDARAHKLRLAKPDDELFDLLVAVIVVDLATSGRIIGVTRSPFTVTLEGGRTFRQDETGRAMVFTDE